MWLKMFSLISFAAMMAMMFSALALEHGYLENRFLFDCFALVAMFSAVVGIFAGFLNDE